MILTAFLISSSDMTKGGANRILHHQQSPLDLHLFIPLRRFSEIGSDAYILTCVGLANSPLLFINKHNCQAVLPFFDFVSSITTPLNSPLPLMIFMNGEFSFFNSDLKISPRRCDLSARSSRMRTSRAVMATAHPRGFLIRISYYQTRSSPDAKAHPPYVEPCSPGLIHNMTSLFANTHETGYTESYQPSTLTLSTLPS